MDNWNKVYKFLEKNIENFSVREKENSFLNKVISKILFFTNYDRYWTTIYPCIYKPKSSVSNYITLQHEAVHLLDMKTFFGLLPKMPEWFNSILYSIFYLSPQVFAIFSLLAFFNLWWLLCLLFLAPIPSPFRFICEVRAYRRNVELGTTRSYLHKYFMNSSYYFMFPFRKVVDKSLRVPSPYKQIMDDIK